MYPTTACMNFTSGYNAESVKAVLGTMSPKHTEENTYQLFGLEREDFEREKQKGRITASVYTNDKGFLGH